MDELVRRRIDELANEFPFMVNAPATSDEITKAETDLKLKFPDDYKDLLGITSGAMMGPYPFFGTRANELMDRNLNSVVGATTYYRREKWPIPDHSFVISQDHAGNPIYYDDGAIRKYDHDAGATDVVADRLEAFVLKCLAI